MKFINPVFTVEGEDYTGQVTELELVPDVEQTVTKTLSPTRVIVDTDSPSWAMTLTIEQGSELHELLLTTAPGTALDGVFQAFPGVGKRKGTFSFASMPPNLGGTRGDVLLSQVTLQILDTIAWSVSV